MLWLFWVQDSNPKWVQDAIFWEENGKAGHDSGNKSRMVRKRWFQGTDGEGRNRAGGKQVALGAREVGSVIGPCGVCRVDLPRTWRSTGGCLRLQNRPNKTQKQWRNSGGKLLSFAAAAHVFFGVVKTINWCLNPLACKSTGETLAPIAVLIQWDWLALVTCCDEKLSTMFTSLFRWKVSGQGSLTIICTTVNICFFSPIE